MGSRCELPAESCAVSGLALLWLLLWLALVPSPWTGSGTATAEASEATAGTGTPWWLTVIVALIAAVGVGLSAVLVRRTGTETVKVNEDTLARTLIAVAASRDLR